MKRNSSGFTLPFIIFIFTIGVSAVMFYFWYSNYQKHNIGLESGQTTEKICPTPPVCNGPMTYGDPMPGSTACPAYFCPSGQRVESGL